MKCRKNSKILNIVCWSKNNAAGLIYFNLFKFDRGRDIDDLYVWFAIPVSTVYDSMTQVDDMIFQLVLN